MKRSWTTGEIVLSHFRVRNLADRPSRGCPLDDLIERIKFWKEDPDFQLKEPAVSNRAVDEKDTSDVDLDSIDDLKLFYTQSIADAEANVADRQAHVMAAQGAEPAAESTAPSPVPCFAAG